MAKSVPKRIQTCFRVIFSKKFNAQCSMEGRVFENSQKNQKIFKIPKMPKIVPESIQTCFERVLGQIFRKFFCSVFRGGSSFRKISNFFFKIPKMPKSVPKRIQTCFRVIFSKKFNAQYSMEGRVFENFQENQKILKIPKMPKIVPKSMQTCFEHVLGQTFRKIFGQCSMECRVYENFQKKIFSKFQKWPKVFPKVSKRVSG